MPSLAIAHVWAIPPATSSHAPSIGLGAFAFIVAGGNGTYPLIGSPEDVAEQLVEIARTGFAGATISFVNFLDELPYFIDALNGPRRMEVVWDGLASRGLPSGDVERIMGGNLLRLYRDVIGGRGKGSR